MNTSIRIIGIDPGLRRTGWGVIESDGHRLEFVASGTVTSSTKGELAYRLVELFEGLSQVPVALDHAPTGDVARPLEAGGHRFA